LALLVEGALIANAFGILFEPRFAGYLVGLLLPLWTAVAMFIRAILSADGLSQPRRPATPPAEPEF
jgi:hypothetical protein